MTGTVKTVSAVVCGAKLPFVAKNCKFRMTESVDHALGPVGSANVVHALYLGKSLITLKIMSIFGSRSWMER